MTIGAIVLEGQFFESANPGYIIGGLANTKGTPWTELIASTLRPSIGMLLTLGDTSNVDQLIDIGIGAAAFEVVIISNIEFGQGLTGIAHLEHVFIPFSIPAGSRISTRIQSVSPSGVCAVAVTMVYGETAPGSIPSKATTYGANTADSGGVSVDPGATADTKGVYSEITASTTSPIRWLLISLGNQSNAIRTYCRWFVDLAIGAAGSEVVVIPNIPVRASSVADGIFGSLISLPCTIPVGSRIAIRAECSINDATDRLFDAVVTGFS